MGETAVLITAEEFLADPRYEGWELIDGVPKEAIVAYRAAVVTMVVGHRLLTFLDEHPGGQISSPEQRFKLWPDRPNHVRRPDIAYFRAGRVPDWDAGDLASAPDLVIEVVSTHEDAQDVERKRIEYFKAGVRLMWVVYPATNTVHVYRTTGLAEMLSVGDTLTGDPVLPGFAVAVESLFPD